MAAPEPAPGTEAFSSALDALVGVPVRLGYTLGLPTAERRLRVLAHLVSLQCDPAGSREIDLPENLAVGIREEDNQRRLAAPSRKVVRMRIRLEGDARRAGSPEGKLVRQKLGIVLPRATTSQIEYLLESGTPVHDVPSEDARSLEVLVVRLCLGKVELEEERTLTNGDVVVPATPPEIPPRVWDPVVPRPDALHAASSLAALAPGRSTCSEGAPAATKDGVGRIVRLARDRLGIAYTPGTPFPYLGQARGPGGPATDPVEPLFVLSPEQARAVLCILPLVDASSSEVIGRARKLLADRKRVMRVAVPDATTGRGVSEGAGDPDLDLDDLDLGDDDEGNELPEIEAIEAALQGAGEGGDP